MQVANSAARSSFTALTTALGSQTAMSAAQNLSIALDTPPEGGRRPNFSNGIIITLITFFSIGTLCFLAFCIVRRLFRDIYASRRYLVGGRPPKLSDGLFSWIPQLLFMPESVLISTVGIDGIMLLRFFSMGAKFFAVLTLFGLGVMAPVNYYASPPSFSNSTGILHEDVLLPALTMHNVPDSSPLLYYHLSFTWFLSLLVYVTLGRYFKQMSVLKNEYDAYVLRRTRMSKIDQRSVMVFGIPRELRHEVDLAGYFESLGLGKVENVVICRRWSKLQRAVEHRAKYLLLLESVYNKVIVSLRKNNSISEMESVLRDAGTYSASFSTNEQSLLVRNWGSARVSEPSFRQGDAEPIDPWSDVTGLDDSGDNPMTPSDLINGLQPSSGRRLRLVSDDPENQPLLDSNLPNNLKLDYDNPNVKEILSRLDAVAYDKRPRHRLGVLGLVGKHVDSASYYAAKFSYYDKLVKKLRNHPEHSQATSTGFVTFESPESAILAAQVNISTKPYSCICRKAPEPRDIYWRNLSSPVAFTSIKLARNLFVTVVHLLLVFFSTVIITTINVLVTVESLQTVFPGLQHFLSELSPRWNQFIKGVVPAVGVSIWTGSLPTLLIFLSKVQGLEAESWIDQSVLSKYFFYQLYNILLVQTIVPNWVAGLDMIRKSPAEIINIFGSIIPMASPGQINYVMLQATAVYPAQLLLIGPLLLTWFLRVVSWKNATSREVSNAYYPSIMFSINYGVAYPVPILVFCVGVVYAPVAPLILPFCMLFFSIVWFIYRYILLYVNIPRYESVGLQTPMVVRRCLVGVLIMQLTMMGALAIKAGKDGASGYFKMVFSVFPLICITIGLFWWFMLGYEKVVAHTSMEILGDVATQLSLENDGKINQEGSSLTTSSAPLPNTPFVVRDSRQAVGSNSLFSPGPDEETTAKELSSIVNDENAVSPKGRRKSISRTISSMGSLRIKSKHAHGGSTSSSYKAPSLSTGELNNNIAHSSNPFSSGIADTAADWADHLSPNSVGRASSVGALSPPSQEDAALLNKKEDFLNDLRKTSVPGVGEHSDHGAHAADGNDPSCSLAKNPWNDTMTKEMKGEFGKAADKMKETTMMNSDQNPTADANGSPSHQYDSFEVFQSNANLDVAHNRSTESEPVLPTQITAHANVDMTQTGSSSGALLPMDGEEAHIKFHVEPPMTRVYGILDAPFGAATAAIPAEEEMDPMFFGGAEQDDLTLHTYLHPALVGRLPIAWLPDVVQPQLLEETRRGQRRVQRDLYKRTVSLLHVGVQLDREAQLRTIAERSASHQSGSGNGGVSGSSSDVDSDEAADDEFFGSMLQWRGNRWEQRSGGTSWLRSAVDNFAGWFQVLLA